MEKVNCVGACSIAPVIIVNKTVHGKVTPDKLMKEMKTLKEGEAASTRIMFKNATWCQFQGSQLLKYPVLIPGLSEQS